MPWEQQARRRKDVHVDLAAFTTHEIARLLNFRKVYLTGHYADDDPYTHGPSAARQTNESGNPPKGDDGSAG
jgi:hypothetical protein